MITVCPCLSGPALQSRATELNTNNLEFTLRWRIATLDEPSSEWQTKSEIAQTARE